MYVYDEHMTHREIEGREKERERLRHAYVTARPHAEVAEAAGGCVQLCVDATYDLAVSPLREINLKKEIREMER